MIADISKGAPRQAGEGVVHLAKFSGRPIIPMALATSRHYIVKRAWDRTTINLPFGRRCLRLGAPIYVPADAGDDEIAAIRQKVTEELNRVTADAYRLVEAPEMSRRWARLALGSYRWAGAALYPFLGSYVAYRTARGKEERSRRRRALRPRQRAAARRPAGLVPCGKRRRNECRRGR